MADSSTCPRVTVVIPNWNTRRWLDDCLNGLRAQNYRDFLVILVDSGSADGSVPYLRSHFPEVRVATLNQNRGFAAAVNAGIRETGSEYVVLLNVDTVPRPDWLANLVQAIEQSPPEVGCLASKMLSLTNPGLIDDAGDTFSWYGSARKRGLGEPAVNYDQPTEVFSACAGAALYRRTFLEEVGLFDEGFTSYLEDIDLGFRGRLLGYRCLYVPTAEVLHQGQGAGTRRGQYVYLMTRNRLAVLLKCVPTALWLKHAYTLLYGQFYFFLVYKKPCRSVAGYFSLLRALPRILRQRRAIQVRRKISNHALESMLSSNLGEPTLRDIVKVRLGWK
jgi:GT2 family glycosyltransferase